MAALVLKDATSKRLIRRRDGFFIWKVDAAVYSQLKIIDERIYEGRRG